MIHVIRISCAVTLTITSIVFTGYALPGSGLHTLIFDNVPMAFTTALCLTLLAISILLYTKNQ